MTCNLMRQLQNTRRYSDNVRASSLSARQILQMRKVHAHKKFALVAAGDQPDVGYVIIFFVD